MGRLISMLDLHKPFLNLGRYIRSFLDAEFVVLGFKEMLQQKMEQSGTDENLVDGLVDCCKTLKGLNQTKP